MQRLRPALAGSCAPWPRAAALALALGLGGAFCPAPGDPDPEQVCCLLHDQPFWLSAELCTQGGGTALDDGARCDAGPATLCCLVGDGYTTKAVEECLREGEPQPVSACEEVCCDAADGASVEPRGACENPARLATVAGAAGDCDELCCQLGAESYETLPRFACAQQAGAPVSDATLCDQVCCQQAGDDQVRSRATCVQAGGTARAAVADCDEVCCGMGMAGFDLMARHECAEVQGTVSASATDCEQVCCQANALQVQDRGVCLSGDVGGTVVGGVELCDEICCQLGALQFFTAARHACEQQGGMQAASVDQCERVCCLDGAESLVLSRHDCTSAGVGGTVVGEPTACDSICCDQGASGVTTLPRHACTQAGGTAETDATLCDEVCCTLGGTGFGTLSRHACLAASGTVASDATLCDEVCCLSNGSYEVALKGICEEVYASGSAVGEPAACDKVCCFMGEGYHYVSSYTCTGYAGTLADPLECDRCVFEDVPLDCSSPPSSQPCKVGPGACLEGICLFTTLASPGTACGEETDCHTYECDVAGGCQAVPKCPVPTNACREATCTGGACGEALKAGAGCDENSDCTTPGQVCLTTTCQCDADPCGNNQCEELLGEDSTTCPADCGCAALKRAKGSPADFCGNHYVREAAPAGCWCDEACGWRSEGCCADKIDLCGPRCGDGRCSSQFSLETPCTCPADCTAAIMGWSCPDLSGCGDGLCAQDSESLPGMWGLACLADCGCAGIIARHGEQGACHGDWRDEPFAAGSTACNCAMGGEPFYYSDCPDSNAACGLGMPANSCPNGNCQGYLGENNSTCPQDCPAPAADGVCQTWVESALSYLNVYHGTLPVAGIGYECAPWYCGDFFCQSNETAESCPLDCRHSLWSWGGRVGPYGL